MKTEITKKAATKQVYIFAAGYLVGTAEELDKIILSLQDARRWLLALQKRRKSK